MMTKSQIKKRDEIADSMSTREFNKRYGKDRGKNVKYATATKLAMKEKVSIVEKPYKSNVETTIKSNGIQKIMGKQKEKTWDELMRNPKVVIVLCTTGFLRVSLLMGSLVGFNSVVNMQENPVPNNLDKQQNPSVVPVK